MPLPKITLNLINALEAQAESETIEMRNPLEVLKEEQPEMFDVIMDVKALPVEIDDYCPSLAFLTGVSLCYSLLRAAYEVRELEESC
tara:strand:- start:250 stop:510 length:261 start_codon:yes stop_codon:yes gene_type:complete